MRPQLAIAISVISIMGLSVNATAAAADQPLELPGITQQGTGADSYAFTIGDVRVTALSDGSVPQNLHKLLHGITKEKIDERLAHAYQNSPAEASITGFLLEVGDRIVLVDTGAGEQFGPGIGGNLLDSLDAVGFSPDDVTDVLITHAHSDHVGGSSKMDKSYSPTPQSILVSRISIFSWIAKMRSGSTTTPGFSSKLFRF
ncbi:MBL fold metallo-hydrolase [Marinobacter sp. AC-23]|uniref:MBL fold metallo-hydrolase n=1 Tax=Marinobacter sp. AC-23 TaxID=1879031 RepID=UPI0011139026|nr:MBL fold metallo-hydrolase [Marinobacter sp. AC-23]